MRRASSWGDGARFGPYATSRPSGSPIPRFRSPGAAGGRPCRAVTGFGDGLYHPESILNRAQLAKMLVLLLDIPVSENLTSPFWDLTRMTSLPTSTWPQPKSNIVRGLGPHSFGLARPHIGVTPLPGHRSTWPRCPWSTLGSFKGTRTKASQFAAFHILEPHRVQWRLDRLSMASRPA